LISESLFEKANKPEISSSHKGISRKSKYKELALKRFLVEAESGNPFTGYIKKGIFYFKTRGTSAPFNMCADKLNDLFSNTLSRYTINKSVNSLLERKVLEIINEKFKDELKESALIKTKLNDLRTKKIKIEERFIDEEIPVELYKKYTEKYKQEELELKQQI